MQQRLLDAGFKPEDMFLGGPTDRKKNLVVRYRGTGRQQPILFIGHEDVVEARREDWTTDPISIRRKRWLLLWSRHAGHERERR